MLRPQRFGPAGFVRSIAWAQLRPADSAVFASQRKYLERRAARLVPFLKEKTELHGLKKIQYKLNRSRVPRSPVSARELAALLG
jgi:hypothetical protein